MSENEDGEENAREDKFDARIKLLLRAEPFVPFTIVVTSGDRFEVTSPFSLVISEKTIWTVELRKSGTFWFRKNQIVGVEIREAVV